MKRTVLWNLATGISLVMNVVLAFAIVGMVNGTFAKPPHVAALQK